MFRRVGIAVALACLLAAAGAGAASAAGSLVFIRGNNVWLANTDGSGQFQVTLDGSPGSPYEGPSQADDGTILAVRQPPGGRRQLVRMTQSGALLNEPVNTPAPGTGAIDARISPDGRLVAYWFVTTVNDPFCIYCVNVASEALISHADRFTNYDEVGTPNTGIKPSWISNDTILLSNSNATQWTYRLGTREGVEWFEDTDTGFQDIRDLDDSELSRGLDRLALVRGDDSDALLLYAASGPPATPDPRCEFTGASGGRFVGPTWSNDGQTLAWQEGDGIWIDQIPSLADCNTIPQPTLVIPGGSEPDLGPAAVNPGPRPGCGNPGNLTACQQTPPPCGTPGAAACPRPPPCTSCSSQPGPLADRLRTLLADGATALGRLKLGGLLRRGGFRVAFTAPGRGTLLVRLTSGRGRRRLVLASGRRRFGAAGRGTLTVALTHAGARALRRADHVKTTLQVTFTPSGARAGTRTRTVRLRR